ncbi:MAG: D-alanyl-D-alanine carboxypeptidase/D-alanyl-D-alanine-endopeptidase [Acidobacteriota bacterium]|nr:D-alanyl-D-alanine carboxypeptidase/D-alanyl-D-alanine-endopeptidase [Acidobacteriota bacterium]
MERWQLEPGELGLLAVDADTFRPVLAHRPDQPLRPASTMKLLTTACALERLGPTRRFETVFRADRRPDAEGRIEGSLYVVGGGDPLLRGEDMWVALRELAALGTREISGDLVVDGHLFGPPARPASWPPARRSQPYEADQQALALAWNSIEVIVLPGPAPGTPARIATFPLAAGVELAGRPRTGTSTSITAGYQPGEKGRAGRILVQGTVAAGGPPYRRWLHLGQPLMVAGRALSELLPAAGIHLHGGLRRGRAPDTAPVLLRRTSPPLAEIVAATNKFSSNFAAEILLRLLAVRPGDPPATTRAGLKVLEGCLDRWGIDRSRLILADGSGLAPVDRLTPRSLVAVLQRAERAADWGPELLTSLPRAAEDGTLRRRLASYRGRLRAKTGSLTGVSTLAGKLVLEDGRRLLFAILVQRKPPRPAPAALVDELLAAVEEALPAPGPENSQAVDDALPAPGDAHPAASRPAPGGPRRRVG